MRTRVDVLALALLVLAGCRPRGVNDWAQPVGDLDGPVIDALRAASEETGVPLPALVVFANEQTAFVEASELTVFDGEPLAELPEDASSERPAVWGLEDEQDLSGPRLSTETPRLSLELDGMPTRVGVFGLTQPQVAWAAGRLGVSRHAIARDLETHALAAATLLAALATADGTATEPPSADDWLDAMVTATGLESAAFRAEARERMAASLEDGFSAVTEDGEAIILVRPLRARSTGSRSESIVGGARDEGDPAVYFLTNGRGNCTGSLIAPRVVLTARHCVVDAHDHLFSPLDMRVAVGDGQERGDDARFVHTYGVARIELAPGASPIVVPDADHLHGGINPSIPNDLALLVLTTVARETPLALGRVDPESLVGTDTVSVGFGRRPDGGVGEKFRVGSHVSALIDGFLLVGASICQGDSGGPLLDEEGAIHGVASFGSSDDCGTAEGGYNEVARHLPWIDSVIARVAATCAPTPEICNGVDDDCDGERDEGCDVHLTLTERRHAIERRILPPTVSCGEPPAPRPNPRYTPGRTQRVDTLWFSAVRGRPRDIADRMQSCGVISLHFVVGRDGRIVQLVETADTAHPDPEGSAGDGILIGVETDGGSLSAEGYLALADLVAMLIRRHPDLDLVDSLVNADSAELDGALLERLVLGYEAGRIPTVRRDREVDVLSAAEAGPSQRVVVDAACRGSALNCATPDDPMCGTRLCAREPDAWERAEALGPARAFAVSGDPRVFDGWGNEIGRVAPGTAVYIDYGVAKTSDVEGEPRPLVQVVATLEGASALACPGSPSPALGGGWMRRDAIVDSEGRLAAMPTIALRPPVDTDYAARTIRAFELPAHEGEEPPYFVPRRTCAERDGVVGVSALDALASSGIVRLWSSIPGSGLGAHPVDLVPVSTSFHVALGVAPRVAPLYRAGESTSFASLHFVYGFAFDGRARRHGWIPLEALGASVEYLAHAPHEAAGDLAMMPEAEGVLGSPRVRLFFVDREGRLVQLSRIRRGRRYDRAVIDAGPFIGAPAAVRRGREWVVAARRENGELVVFTESDGGGRVSARLPLGLSGDPFLTVDGAGRVTVVASASDGLSPDETPGIALAVERADGTFATSSVVPPGPALSPTAAWDHGVLAVFSVSLTGRVQHLELTPDGAGGFNASAWTHLAVTGATPALPFVFSAAIPSAGGTRTARLLGVIVRDETGAVAVQIAHPDGGWFASATRSRALCAPFDGALVPMRALFDVRRDGPGSVVRVMGRRTTGVLGWVDGRVICDEAARCTWQAQRSGVVGDSPGRLRGFAVADLGAEGFELFAERRAAGRLELVTTRPRVDLDEDDATLGGRTLGVRLGGAPPQTGGL